MKLLLDELCATGWVRLTLGKARDFAGWVDRQPQLELLDFEALAGWAGFQRKAERWNSQLLAHLREHWDHTSGTAKQALLDYLGRNLAPIQLLVDIAPAFEEALFVENLVTFEAMADRRQPGWSCSLLVYAAGFKGSAKRLRSRQGCRLYVRAGRGDALALPSSAGPGLDEIGAWLFGRSMLPVRFREV